MILLVWEKWSYQITTACKGTLNLIQLNLGKNKRNFGTDVIYSFDTQTQTYFTFAWTMLQFEASVIIVKLLACDTYTSSTAVVLYMNIWNSSGCANDQMEEETGQKYQAKTNEWRIICCPASRSFQHRLRIWRNFGSTLCDWLSFEFNIW